MTSFVELRGIELRLARFHLELDAGFPAQFTGILGPSGAGKTTLLEIVAGLRRPERGRVVVAGRVLFDAQEKIFVPPHRRRIGYVPQDLALFPHLTVRANLLYGFRNSDERPEAGLMRNVAEALEIAPLLERKPEALSGGEKQRVAFARALLANPALLLLDEPLTGLDAALKERILRFVVRIRDVFRVPTLYVTHSVEEVGALCRHVAVLSEGKLIRNAPVEQILLREQAPVYRLREP